MFRSIVLTALGVALIVGMFLSAVQALSVSPIITAAEVFEIAELMGFLPLCACLVL